MSKNFFYSDPMGGFIPQTPLHTPLYGKRDVRIKELIYQVEENARFCLVEVKASGTKERRPCWAERAIASS